MRDSLFYRQPEFEIVPMTSDHCRAVAELHGQRFPRAFEGGHGVTGVAQGLGQHETHGAVVVHDPDAGRLRRRKGHAAGLGHLHQQR